MGKMETTKNSWSVSIEAINQTTMTVEITGTREFFLKLLLEAAEKGMTCELFRRIKTGME